MTTWRNIRRTTAYGVALVAAALVAWSDVDATLAGVGVGLVLLGVVLMIGTGYSSDR